MKRLTIRFHLRLALLFTALVCTLFAWYRCRLIMQQYYETGNVTEADLRHILEYRYTHAVKEVQRIRLNPASCYDYDDELKAAEARAALFGLELAGFDVRRAGQYDGLIVATDKVDPSFFDDALIPFLKQINGSIGTYRVVDLTRVNLGNSSAIATHIIQACPEYDVRY